MIMKKQFYFKNIDSEICYNETYFKDYMSMNNINEIEVYIAEPYRSTDTFWCSAQCFCGDDSQNTCGKQCVDYRPRNGKSGCCRSYSRVLYSHGEKVKLNIK